MLIKLEAIDPQPDRASGGKNRELSAVGRRTNCSLIFEGVFQGASSSSDRRLTNSHTRLGTSESRRDSSINIQKQDITEKMDVQHQEGQNSPSAGINGDGRNQLLEDHIQNEESTMASYTCLICNKTIQLRSLQQHLKSGKHKGHLEASIERNRIADIGPIHIENENAAPLVYDISLTLQIFNRSDITTLKSIPKIIRRNIALAISNLYRISNGNPLHIRPHVELLIFSKIVLANMTSSESRNISNKKRRKAQIKYTKCQLCILIR